MGVECVVAAITRDEAQALCEEPQKLKELEYLDTKGLTLLMLARLWAILSKEPLEIGDALAQFSTLCELDEAWVIKLPAELSHKLADIEQCLFEETSKRWKEVREVQASGWTLLEVQLVLERLMRICQLAKKRSLVSVLRISL
jgi:hypothetical protein